MQAVQNNKIKMKDYTITLGPVQSLNNLENDEQILIIYSTVI